MLHRLRAAARALFAAAVLLTLTTTLSACNKVPLIAPSGSSLTVFSTTTVLPVNGSAEIVAVILEGGQGSGTGAGGGNTAGAGTPVHDGTTVMFTTTLGRLDPAEAQTSGGRATVKLLGDGRSGTATITAFSGAARNTVDILIGAAAAARVLRHGRASVVAADWRHHDADGARRRSARQRPLRVSRLPSRRRPAPSPTVR